MTGKSPGYGGTRCFGQAESLKEKVIESASIGGAEVAEQENQNDKKIVF